MGKEDIPERAVEDEVDRHPSLDVAGGYRPGISFALQGRSAMERKKRNQSPSPEAVREARGTKACEFLNDVLFPETEHGTFEGLTRKEQRQRLGSLLEEYKEKHPGPGDDFDLAMVLGKVLPRVLLDNPRSLKETGQPLPDIATYKKISFLLLEAETTTDTD